MKNSRLFLCILLLFLSCIGFSQQLEAEEKNQAISIMEFENDRHDYGIINQGDVVSHVFTFTNTGDQTLTLINAKGSCGCTVPYFPKHPIMPGESSEIEVEFDSKGKRGKQTKKIVITANTEPANTYLTITGEINPSITVKDEGLNILKRDDQEKIEALHPNCVAIYPNPTSDILRLELKENIGLSANVKIHNQRGQEVMEKTIEHISKEATSFDVKSFDPGIYFVSIVIENKDVITQCFVVSR